MIELLIGFLFSINFVLILCVISIFYLLIKTNNLSNEIKNLNETLKHTKNDIFPLVKEFNKKHIPFYLRLVRDLYTRLDKFHYRNRVI